MAMNQGNLNQGSFFEVFLTLLKGIFDFENQIVDGLPKVIKAATNPELKDALSQHLDETKNQVQRLKKIFKMLNENPTGKPCPAMQGMMQEAQEVISKNTSPNVKDANLIICCQQVEHYEIASYGSARTLARHLHDAQVSDRVDFDEIADLLQQTLDEESAADEKLTDIAEGGFFSQGINDEAEKEQTQTTTKKRNPAQ
ncbi:ferritin-like domain-containing protein [Candidatus Protochlamydia phocaeensis]|uniref:ferritin-like domain-containing protein n=1 Tax=Candidatus Protochlamydia phocaeensis TaxID=1414722 RepID=UPI00083863E9|nr:ferritin-like domain-containing protein [Candidatus Protochlamydia phocaeensis]